MRTCLFCDKTANSNEHASPKWLVQYLEHDRPRITVKFPDGTNRDYPGKSVEVQSVCHDCNTGWMSKLESSVSPFMKHMIDGDPISISKEDGALLAAWVVKTRITCGSGVQEAESTMTPKSYRVSLREKMLAPHGAVITAGYLKSDAIKMLVHIQNPRSPMPGVVHLEQMSLAIGHLVLNYAFVGKKDNAPQSSPTIGPGKIEDDPKTVGLWPWPARIDKVEWPPPGVYWDDSQIGIAVKKMRGQSSHD